MKYAYPGILLVLIVIAAAVCGCTSGPAASPAANSTSTIDPGGDAMPTVVAGGAFSANQLFNMSNLHMYEYKLTSVTGGQTTTNTYKIEYSDSSFQGTPAKLTTMTYDMPGIPGGQMIVGLYYDPVDNHLFGGSYRIAADGQAMDFSIPADEGGKYTANDWASTAGPSVGDVPLASSGAETFTVNGQPYVCTKYTWTADGRSYAAWYTPQAPMPLKYQWTDNKGDTWTMELLNWS